MVRLSLGEWSIFRMGGWLAVLIVATPILGAGLGFWGDSMVCDIDCEIARQQGQEVPSNDLLGNTIVTIGLALITIGILCIPYAIMSIRDRSRRLQHHLEETTYEERLRRMDLMRESRILWPVWFMVMGLTAAIAGMSLGEHDGGPVWTIAGLVAIVAGGLMLVPWKNLARAEPEQE